MEIARNGLSRTTAFVLVTMLQLTGRVAAAQNSLPAPWQQTDIGDVGAAASASEDSDGALNIAGAGSDIWGTADSFHFVYQTMCDGDVWANHPSEQSTSPFAKIGIMIRQSLDPGSAHVVLDVKPDGSVEFMTRGTANGSTTFVAGLSSTGPGARLHLSRNFGQVIGEVCD